MAKYITPKEVSQEVGVGINMVLDWIHRKELRASNVSLAKSRPRWVIAESDLQAFLDARSNQKPKPKPQRKRKDKLRIQEIV